MLGHELAIEQAKAADFHPRHQPRQCDLRRVSHQAEHRFAKERSAKRDAVQPADQPAIVPAFDRMGMAGVMKANRGAFDIAIDPRLVAVGAGAHDLFECPIAAYFEATRAKPARKRARAMELGQRDDRPAPRFNPEHLGGVTAVSHREDPGGIAAKHQRGIERCAHNISRTTSCGRHRRTPFSVSTNGRLMRIGCAIIASRMALSLTPG